MEIINQHAKKIMEGCKERARDAGLSFVDESIEYLVTNQDLLELQPKGMIPTLYDYWVHDLELMKSRKEYELYPNNPFETVINSRPALSFYNDNNPDWLNVMIFYHVIGHMDFMQNNSYFRHTWDDDFVGQALADKRLINDLRTKHGRWVDYVIEFTRGIDNIVGYYQELSGINRPEKNRVDRLDYFFDVFLQKELKVSDPEYLKEIDRYNLTLKDDRDEPVADFISETQSRYPEFETCFEKYKEGLKPAPKDLIQFLMQNSPVLNRDENLWMKSVMEIVRNTSLYFAPQMRTKIMNEGWSSYWHFELFMNDDRIKGHEADFARINSFVTSLPKMGVNPYAIGLRLFEYIESQADKGRISYEFERLHGIEDRKAFNKKTGKGREFIFKLRENCCDFNFINDYVDQDFCDLHNLVIIGERVNQQRMTREYYIKSRKAIDYRNMLLDTLMHPPAIKVDEKNTIGSLLRLVHTWEGKQLVPEFIDNVMAGIEFLWGGEVGLETHLVRNNAPHKIIYRMKDRHLETLRNEK